MISSIAIFLGGWCAASVVLGAILCRIIHNSKVLDYEEESGITGSITL